MNRRRRRWAKKAKKNFYGELLVVFIHFLNCKYSPTPLKLRSPFLGRKKLKDHKKKEFAESAKGLSRTLFSLLWKTFRIDTQRNSQALTLQVSSRILKDSLFIHFSRAFKFARVKDLRTHSIARNYTNLPLLCRPSAMRRVNSLHLQCWRSQREKKLLFIYLSSPSAALWRCVSHLWELSQVVAHPRGLFRAFWSFSFACFLLLLPLSCNNSAADNK